MVGICVRIELLLSVCNICFYDYSLLILLIRCMYAENISYLPVILPTPRAIQWNLTASCLLHYAERQDDGSRNLNRLTVNSMLLISY
jgi:hypothetical protein